MSKHSGQNGLAWSYRGFYSVATEPFFYFKNFSTPAVPGKYKGCFGDPSAFFPKQYGSGIISKTWATRSPVKFHEPQQQTTVALVDCYLLLHDSRILKKFDRIAKSLKPFPFNWFWWRNCRTRHDHPICIWKKPCFSIRTILKLF